MKYIDIENWDRKDHYNFFKNFDYPQFNICANVDMTKFYKFIKDEGYPFFVSFVFAAASAANSVKEFRLRIREDKIVEHDIVNPSFTVMTSKGVFSFCRVEFRDNFKDFSTDALKKIEDYKRLVNLKDEPGADNLLFISSMPWVSFTGLVHPINMHPVDSVPRITWGKYFEENGKIKIPFSIQAHHALVDGLHVGQYFEKLQQILDAPENYY